MVLTTIGAILALAGVIGLVLLNKPGKQVNEQPWQQNDVIPEWEVKD